MDAWDLHRYERPYLAVESIDAAPGGSTVIVRAAHDRMTLACASPDLAAELVKRLERLRDPDDRLWRTVLANRTRGAWIDLVRRLDERSFLDDAAGGAAPAALERERSRIHEEIDATTACIRARLPAERRSMATVHAERLIDAVAGEDSDVRDDSNFFLSILGWQTRYLRHAAPPTLAAIRDVLSRLLHVLGASREHAGRSFESDSRATPPVEHASWGPVSGLYAERDRRAHLTALADLFVRSVGPDAARQCAAPPAPTAAVSGLGFVLGAERVTRAALDQLGEGRLRATLSGDAKRSFPLLVGCHVEQYHVTTRFVEMLAPLLRKRFSSGLRDRIARYYEEESGHDALEMAACARLGVSAAALARALPMPLHLAFVDVLTEIGDRDPLGFMASVMVTEGMLDERATIATVFSDAKRLSRFVREATRRHERLNADGHHSSLPRLLLGDVAAVSPAAYRRAIDNLLLVVELNHRAWDAAVEFHGERARPVLHGWLSRPERITRDRSAAQRSK